jgi:hypothetical protein
VVQSGTASLEKLVQLSLGEVLDKSPAVRLSKWSEQNLSSSRTKYAVLDAVKSLEVFEHLQGLQDWTLRLSAEAAVPSLEIGIVPSHGNVASMATRAAVYLRMYCEQWERNQRVKDAVKSSKTELELLEKVNDKHMLFPKHQHPMRTLMISLMLVRVDTWTMAKTLVLPTKAK